MELAQIKDMTAAMQRARHLLLDAVWGDDRVSRNRDMAALASAWAYAAAAGLVSENPIIRVRRNRETPRKRYVSDEELGQFLAHCCGRRLRAYVSLKLATGLRQGQLLALTWADWDGDALTVAPAKGGRETVYTGAELGAAIEAVRRAWAGRDFLFGVSGDALRMRWRRAMRRFVAAGGSRFREHDLRAKVATDAGGLERAPALLGHQTPAITERVYRRGPKRVAAARAGVALSAAGAATGPQLGLDFGGVT